MDVGDCGSLGEKIDVGGGIGVGVDVDYGCGRRGRGRFRRLFGGQDVMMTHGCLRLVCVLDGC